VAFKVIGIVLIVAAVAIGVIPYFNNCGAQGMALTTADGRQVPMKCYWTSRAAIGTAVPLGIVGLGLTLSRRKETFRTLGVMGGVLGLVAIALPTWLIGVCAMNSSCVMVMKPSLIMLGGVTASLGVVTTALAQRWTGDVSDDAGDMPDAGAKTA
jgi:hypothetical protein